MIPLLYTSSAISDSERGLMSPKNGSESFMIIDQASPLLRKGREGGVSTAGSDVILLS